MGLSQAGKQTWEPTREAPQTENLGLVVCISVPPGSAIHRASGHPLPAVAGQCWREQRAACFLSHLIFVLSCFFSFFFFFQLALLAGNNERRERASHLSHCSSNGVLIFTFNLVFKKTKGTSLLHLRQV